MERSDLDRDAALLELIAEHRFVTPEHAQTLLGAPTTRVRARLRSLERVGYVRRARPFEGRTSLFLITGKGLRAAGSPLSPPRLHLNCYEHDVGVAWLWLAARAGTFGPLRLAHSERRMRSTDATAPAGREPYAVRLPGLGAAGRERLHYPDLLLVTQAGKRVAIELELSAKGRTRRERILGAYAADARIDAVLYLVHSRAVGRSIVDSARRMGIGHLVRVQRVELRGAAGSSGAQCVAERSARRTERVAAR